MYTPAGVMAQDTFHQMKRPKKPFFIGTAEFKGVATT
jgi:hypothetical protein